MLNYAIIWHVWLVSLVVFRVVHMLSNVLSAYLFSVSTAGSFTNNVSLATTLT